MTPWLQDPDVTLYHGDSLTVLRDLPDESVDCVVTSPPYWGLRDYGTGEWAGGDPDCDHIGGTLGRQDAGRDFTGGGGNREGSGNPGKQQFRDVCGKCGAQRVDQQLGLEPTPDLFVTNMVAVFREVRRVLAPHGTCWVNLGDSYATGTSTPSKPSADVDNGYWQNADKLGRSRIDGREAGLKPKDLVGVPWRVAFALQQPYYTGRITDERDRIWLAAMADGEGCIHVHRRKAGTSAHSTFEKADGTVSEYVRKQDTYGVMVSIDNTSKAIIDRCHAIIGQGSRYTQEAGTGKQQRKQAIHRLTLTGNQARDLLRELYPHLVAKRHEARIAYHCPSSGPEAQAAHEAIKALHNGLDTTVDRPAPPTLLEPGWYLRSDVIWGKPNPMPESVTDRPTKAHEYIFLLTKQPRYWFDAEAVREPAEYGYSPTTNGKFAASVGGKHGSHTVERGDGTGGRNFRSVWNIATQPYPEAHFATYPEELAARCILAGCPQRVCRTCGKPSERIVEIIPESDALRSHGTHPGTKHLQGPQSRLNSGTTEQYHANRRQIIPVGWSDCGHNNWRPGTVLDPFIGSGTTCKVARDHQRHAIGIDLSAEYLQLAARRLQQLSLLAQ